MNTHLSHLHHVSHRTATAVTETYFLETALAFQVAGDGPTATAPEWIQVFPAGPELATNDGRSFKLSDPQAFVDAQRTSAGKPILVDYDHLSSFMPEENGDQTAAGWIEELEVRDGEIWARVAWTVRAAKQIADREWRFISPEFRAHKKTGEVAILDAVALVNRPAFDQMKALARASARKTGDTPMFKEIAKVLGLSDDATEEQVLTAIREKDAELATAKASTVTPSTKDFMPRADYDRVLARAEEAEGKLTKSEKAARESEVETMIASAVKAKKIAPASKGHYVALAMASDAGFEEVKKLTETLPEIVEPSNLDDKTINAHGLSDDDREMCAMLGVSEEDFAKQRAAEKA
ncbi:phage protease [Cognatishimia sp. MH4019]|uniref:phage protease n=1 Tax=Cognatishimia sp. MH4019 TaxID=2854030 RepID=UPI001CD66C55|nr:phage protease [Cognatishimia sp. MH4019]